MTEQNCSTCHHEWGRESVDYCDKCFNGGADGYPEWMPMTNGDQIRKMTDAELARFLVCMRARHEEIACREWLGEVGECTNTE